MVYGRRYESRRPRRNWVWDSTTKPDSAEHMVLWAACICMKTYCMGGALTTYDGRAPVPLTPGSVSATPFGYCQSWLKDKIYSSSRQFFREHCSTRSSSQQLGAYWFIINALSNPYIPFTSVACLG
eukprot:jgi/Chrzof1/12530/Cz06g37160.t1